MYLDFFAQKLAIVMERKLLIIDRIVQVSQDGWPFWNSLLFLHAFRLFDGFDLLRFGIFVLPSK